MIEFNFLPFLEGLAVDLVAAILIAVVFYYLRYRNRPMMAAILMVNLCLFALSGAVTAFELSIGAGFALFAAISILRLRSETTGWTEMAYLLVGLTIGLVCGLPGFDLVAKLTYTLLLVLGIFAVDSIGRFRRRDEQKVSLTLDSTDVSDLQTRVEAILGRSVLSVTVKNVTVNPPATRVDVRFRD